MIWFHCQCSKFDRVGSKSHLKVLCSRDLGAGVCPLQVGKGLTVLALNLKDDPRLPASASFSPLNIIREIAL